VQADPARQAFGLSGVRIQLECDFAAFHSGYTNAN
jgi:hypothetical protein